MSSSKGKETKKVKPFVPLPPLNESLYWETCPQCMEWAVTLTFTDNHSTLVANCQECEFGKMFKKIDKTLPAKRIYEKYLAEQLRIVMEKEVGGEMDQEPLVPIASGSGTTDDNSFSSPSPVDNKTPTTTFTPTKEVSSPLNTTPEPDGDPISTYNNSTQPPELAEIVNTAQEAIGVLEGETDVAGHGDDGLGEVGGEPLASIPETEGDVDMEIGNENGNGGLGQEVGHVMAESGSKRKRSKDVDAIADDEKLEPRRKKAIFEWVSDSCVLQ